MDDHRSKCKTQNYKARIQYKRNLGNLGYNDEFLHTTPEAQSIREKMMQLRVY